MKIELDHSDQTAETGGDVSQTVSVARWIVYFQGALLGVVAATFFIFGMMVGSLTQSKQNGPILIDCQVSGRVMFSGTSGERPDVGAVVLLLPRDARPEKRLDGRSVNPASFVPLENPVIDFVHAAGGAIVRADEQGRFEVYVKAPGDLLSVSGFPQTEQSGETSIDQGRDGSHQWLLFTGREFVERPRISF